MRKRISMLVLSLMLAVMMVACGGAETKKTTTEEVVVEEEVIEEAAGEETGEDEMIEDIEKEENSINISEVNIEDWEYVVWDGEIPVLGFNVAPPDDGYSVAVLGGPNEKTKLYNINYSAFRSITGDGRACMIRIGIINENGSVEEHITTSMEKKAVIDTKIGELDVYYDCELDVEFVYIQRGSCVIEMQFAPCALDEKIYLGGFERLLPSMFNSNEA